VAQIHDQNALIGECYSSDFRESKYGEVSWLKFSFLPLVTLGYPWLLRSVFVRGIVSWYNGNHNDKRDRTRSRVLWSP